MTYNMSYLQSISMEAEIWGGKACSLFQLIENGYNVPAGFVISTEVYQSYVQDEIDWNMFEYELNVFCNRAFNMRQCTLIFRSSANIENNDRIACCGIFESFIHDSNIPLAENVKNVWRSLSSQYSRCYFERVGVLSDTIKMAVIVQEVLKGAYSAVIQTYDIVHQKDRIIVEYGKGALDTVVSGYENANLLYIDRSGATHYLQNGPILGDLIVAQLLHDCLCLEKIWGEHLEIEAQIENTTIYYIQARVII